MKILQNVYILYVVVLISLLNIGWFVYYNNYNSIIAFVTCGLTVYLMNHNMIVVLGITMIIVNTLSMFNLVKIINKEGFKEGKRNRAQRIEARERREARQRQEAKEREDIAKVERDRKAKLEEDEKIRRDIQRQRDNYLQAKQRADELKRKAEKDAADEIIRKALEKALKEAEEEREKLKRMYAIKSSNQTPMIESFKNKNDYDSDNDYESDNDIDDNSDNDIDDNSDDSDDDEQTKYMNDKTIINKLKKLDPLIIDLLTNVSHGHIDTINKTINHITGGNIADR